VFNPFKIYALPIRSLVLGDDKILGAFNATEARIDLGALWVQGRPAAFGASATREISAEAKALTTIGARETTGKGAKDGKGAA